MTAQSPAKPSAACGGRLRCCLPDEKIETKIFRSYRSRDFETLTRPPKRGTSSYVLAPQPPYSTSMILPMSSPIRWA